jgi:hypothetical protein
MSKRNTQYELPQSGEAFNLAWQEADDPWRITRERREQAEREEQARAYQSKMQRHLADCPGVIGFDSPSSPASTGKIVVQPSHVLEASAWLKKRYHVNEAVEVDRAADGIVFEIMPRVRRAPVGGRKVAVRFGKPHQFELEL